MFVLQDELLHVDDLKMGVILHGSDFLCGSIH